MGAEQLKLYFGCGNLRYKGYKGVDIRPLPTVDIVTDISKKLPWNNNEIDEILAESVLEHIPHGFFTGTSSYSRAHLNTIRVLKEWYRVLKKDGKCIVKVPNILGIINCYKTGKMQYRDFWMYLYGGQEYKANTHYIGFDPFTLKEVMSLAGFRSVVLRNCHNLNEPIDEQNAWEMTAIGVK